MVRGPARWVKAPACYARAMSRLLALAILLVGLSVPVASADDVPEPTPRETGERAPLAVPPWGIATLVIGVGGLLLLRKRLKRSAAERHRRAIQKDASAESELAADVRSMLSGSDDEEP